MALYISLEPLSYLRDPDTVIEVNEAGRLIELTTEQAAALPGLVAYWGSGASYLSPQITMLSYDNSTLFPLIGTPFHVFLDQSTGRLWQWNETVHDYTLVSILSPLDPAEIDGITATGTALITAANAAAGRTAIAAGDTSSNTSTSVDGEVAVFSGTAGKTVKRATGSGVAKLTSGVLSTAVSGTDYAPATSGSGVLKGNGAGGSSTATPGTDYVTPGGALGTPASGTLTSCTGLPVAGITASTSTALGVGSLEVGHASDTTVSRVSAGVLAVEGVTITTKSVVSLTTTATLAAVAGREYYYLLGVGAIPTLPTAVSAASFYVLKNVTTGTITVATTSSQTIEGSTTYVLAAGESITLVSDNANWRIV